MELNPVPKIVGRDAEVSKLVGALAKATAGRGDTYFISGEAGVGKTRVIREVEEIARSTNFRTLYGSCLLGARMPYLAFVEALRSGGFDHLFAEESPRVEAVYLVTSTGLPVKEVLRQQTALDPDIFASMLSAVGNFVKDALSLMSGEKKEGFLNTLGYENHRILIEGSPEVSLVAVITGKENEFLIEDMKETLRKVREKHVKSFKDWDGDMRKIEGIEELMDPLVFSGKYDGVQAADGDPMVRRNLLFENVSLGLARHAETEPILLCIEDLQWADPSSLALLHYVSRTAIQHRLLIIGTYRPEDMASLEGGRHLAETLQLMSREGRVNTIGLQRLPPEAIHALLVSLLGSVAFTPRFEGRIYDRTQGNPLYVVELMRMMAEEGTIVMREGAWRLTADFDETEIPSMIHDVIVRRLDRVGAAESKVMDYASIIGYVFSSSVLAESLGSVKLRLLEQLRVLEESHKLVRPRQADWEFDQKMIKDVLYGRIPRELRSEYHSIVAESIEKLNRDDLDAVVGSLALHFYKSGRKEKALPYLTRAAEIARGSYSNKEALTLYREAVQLEDEPEKKAVLLEGIGDVHETIGEYELSMRSYADAIGLAKDAKRLAALKAKMGKVHNRRGEHSEAMKVSSEALEVVEGLETEEEALAFNNIGVALWGRGQHEEAIGLFRKVLEIRSKLGNQRGVANAILNIGLMEIERSRYTEAVNYLKEALAGFEKAGDLANVALVFNNMGNIYNFKGEQSRALHWYARAMKMRERIGDQRGVAYSVGNIGTLSFARGDYDKAMQCYQKALKIGEKIGEYRIVAYSLGSIGLVHCQKGELDEALKFHQRSLGISGDIGDQTGMARALHNTGVTYSGKGEYEKALSYLNQSMTIREKLGEKSSISETCARIAEAHFRKGDHLKALEFGKMANSISREMGGKEFIALSQVILAMVYREQRKWDESIDNFESGIRLYEEAGIENELGTTHCEYALMWKEKGDPRRAEEHLTKAVESFRNLGLERNLRKAEKDLENLGVGRDVSA